MIQGLKRTFWRKSKIPLGLVHFWSLLCPLRERINKQHESLPLFFGSRVIFGAPLPTYPSSCRFWYGDVNQLCTLYIERGGEITRKHYHGFKSRVVWPVYQRSIGCSLTRCSRFTQWNMREVTKSISIVNPQYQTFPNQKYEKLL